MSKFTSFVRAVLPVHFANDALKVGPAVQAEIDKLTAETKVKVDALRAQHSVASVNEQFSKEIADFEAFATRHVALLKADANAKVAAASAVLPPLNLPAGVTVA